MISALQNQSLCICIPTYKRVDLLRLLIQDLLSQSAHPNLLVVVDGDPDSGEVITMLAQTPFLSAWQVEYIPSNHKNLPYQRYLGWLAAHCHHTILYLDDDLRIHQHDAVEKIIAPVFAANKRIVGVTALPVVQKSSSHLDGVKAQRAPRPLFARWLFTWFGSSRGLPPGSLSPSGERIPPRFSEQDYEPVEWLYGRVMAFRMDALTADCFSDALFAAYERHMGKAEDTFLSRRVSFKGEMLIAHCVSGMIHPDADDPRAYPTQALPLGRSIAYSRRLLNDNYRGINTTCFTDRLALFKTYLGNTFVQWLWALITFKRYRWSYAIGYTWGAIQGILLPPQARRLTPHLHWEQETEKAIRAKRILKQSAESILKEESLL
jgi:glycosyltransferase involved in cell wall biosynthesis